MTTTADHAISAYEGLIFATAARYVDIVDDDLDDIRQVLRLKVWKALMAYDGARSALEEERFVFGCLRNQVKDILKSQARRNDARGGRQLYVEDFDGSYREQLEHVHLSESDDVVYAQVEDEPLRLPSTLTEMESSVVVLLMLDLRQAEIAVRLGISRKRVRSAQESIRAKMSDWCPDGAAAEEPTPVAA